MKCPNCSTEALKDARFCSNCGNELQPTPQFVLGVDLDGVVADFYEALRPVAEEWLGVQPGTLTKDVSYGLKEWGISLAQYHELHRFAVTQKEIFATQPPIPGAAATLRRLGFNNSIRVRIITHRLFVKYTHDISVRQTTEWLEEQGIPYWDICFMKTKGEVGADLYIEDSPSNIAALKKLGKNVLIFTNSTNKEVDGNRANDWNEVEKFVLAAVAEWKASQVK